MNEVTQTRKTNYVVAELFKATKMVMHQEVVSLDRLKAAQLRARDEPLVNHRKHRDMGFEVTRGVLVDA